MKKVFLLIAFLFLVGCDFELPIDDFNIKVSFETDGGSAIEPIKFDETFELPIPTKEGYEFLGWFFDESLTENFDLSLITSSITLYAKWEVLEYTISFETNQGSDIESITAEYQTPVAAPSKPTKEGHYFDGWYADYDLTIPYQFVTIPAEDITVYAKWIDTQGFVFEDLEDWTLAIIGYTLDTEELVIPEQFNNKNITVIGEKAFHLNENLITVVIPQGVTTIANQAFDGCGNLRNIIISDTVESIGNYALAGTNIAELIIPNSVRHIGEYAFLLSNSLSLVYIPNSVETIGENAFTDNAIPIVIRCQFESQPSGWDENWRNHFGYGWVIWDFTLNPRTKIEFQAQQFTPVYEHIRSGYTYEVLNSRDELDSYLEGDHIFSDLTVLNAYDQDFFASKQLIVLEFHTGSSPILSVSNVYYYDEDNRLEIHIDMSSYADAAHRRNGFLIEIDQAICFSELTRFFLINDDIVY